MPTTTPRISNASRKHARMLDDIIAHDDTTADEDDAFRSMRANLHLRALSPRQVDWMTIVYKRLELDAEDPAANLASSGAVAPATEPFDDFAARLQWGAKACVPPGRRV